MVDGTTCPGAGVKDCAAAASRGSTKKAASGSSAKRQTLGQGPSGASAPTLAPVTDDPTPPDALKPNHPEEKHIATMTLAEIYAIQGLTQKAIETYRRLLAQDPNNTILRSKLESLKKSSGRQ